MIGELHPSSRRRTIGGWKIQFNRRRASRPEPCTDSRPTRPFSQLSRFALLAPVLWIAVATAEEPEPPVPSLTEALAAGTDVWGEAALRRPDGPSYEFFAGLLPPLRYVNAEFRHYPIVLSAPLAPVKARWISNGSGINSLAKLGSWLEIGTPVAFLLGDQQRPFGEHVARLNGPRLLRGYLPIVEAEYADGDAVYSQRAFAAVAAGRAALGTVWVEFRLTKGQSGRVTAAILSTGDLRCAAGAVRNQSNQVVLRADPSWRWDETRRSLVAELAAGQSAVLCVPTTPAPPPLDSTPELDQRVLANTAAQDRQASETAWEELLGGAVRVETSEKVVNDAWQALLVGLLTIASGDQMNYSAGNAYSRMYAEESSSPIQALLFFGLTDQARRLMPPLLAFQRQPELGFHNAAFQLQLLTRYYWLTRDAELVRSQRATWLPLVERITSGLTTDTGLLPQENYCGDIAVPVSSLSSNANCWRAIRDVAAVQRALGEPAEALEQFAARYRQTILEAVARSEFLQVDPPFIPVALFGAEQPYESLTATMRGSYWNLMSNYLLRSGVFRGEPEKADWIASYLHRRGGVCMGMLRFDQHSGLFANVNAVDDLYSLGYVNYLLEQDQVDRVLVSFYGKLAQGLTRDTFIGAEGTGLVPLDPHGRSMYLPPNAASNAFFLWTLRQLLAQDWDADDDGAPDTLRLLFATPRSWLGDGQTLRVTSLPTAFGPVSLQVVSRLSQGEVTAHVELPPGPTTRTLLRLRLPTAWKIVRAECDGLTLEIDSNQTLDLSGQRGRRLIRLTVQ